MSISVLFAVLLTAGIIAYFAVTSAHPLACGLGVVALGAAAIAADCIREARRGRA